MLAIMHLSRVESLFVLSAVFFDVLYKFDK